MLPRTHLQRKSSRLSARQRGRGDRDSEDGGGLQGALAGAAAPCGAVDAQGRPVARAVDVCAAHELLRMLALWMSLKQLTVAEVAPACQMAPAQLQSLLDASRTDGAQLQLQPAQHDALVAWLEQQSSGLSEAVALAPWQQAVQDAQPEGSAGGSGAQLLAQLASAGGGHSAAAGAGEGRRRLEFSRPHPYLELLLQQAVPAHVADPDSEWVNAAEAAADDAGDGDAPAGSGGQSGAAAGGAQPAEQAGGDGEPPASPQVSQKGLEAGDADAADCGDAAADGSAADAAANATSSGGRGRGRGGRGGRGRGRRGRPPGRGPGGIPRPPKLDEAPSTLVAQAVAALVAAAPPEGALDEQWQLLDSSAPLLAVAPDDEVLAELLALQGELLHQQVVNRARVAVLLERVLSDAPQQAAAAEQWQLVEGEVMGFLQVCGACVDGRALGGVRLFDVLGGPVAEGNLAGWLPAPHATRCTGRVGWASLLQPPRPATEPPASRRSLVLSPTAAEHPRCQARRHQGEARNGQAPPVGGGSGGAARVATLRGAAQAQQRAHGAHVER